MKELILIGGGGHCRSCIDVIEAQDLYRIVGILDLPQQLGGDLCGYPVIGSDTDLPGLVGARRSFLITLGQIKSPARRIELFELLRKVGGRLATIVSPRAHISRHAQIGPGSIVMHDALVNTGARIGANCIINSKALVEHDAIIGDHCHLSTGSIVNGAAEIGAGSFFGSNAVTHQGIRIGAQSLIAAGALVACDLPSGSRFPGRNQRRDA